MHCINLATTSKNDYLQYCGSETQTLKHIDFINTSQEEPQLMLLEMIDI